MVKKKYIVIKKQEIKTKYEVEADGSDEAMKLVHADKITPADEWTSTIGYSIRQYYSQEKFE